MAAQTHRLVRFSLRTALLLVTVAAVWLGWTVMRVRGRQTAIAQTNRFAVRFADPLPPGMPHPTIPWLRELMGDRAVLVVWLHKGGKQADYEYAKRLFPEAVVYGPEGSYLSPNGELLFY
jgi:hypothetical protein